MYLILQLEIKAGYYLLKLFYWIEIRNINQLHSKLDTEFWIREGISFQKSKYLPKKKRKNKKPWVFPQNPKTHGFYIKPWVLYKTQGFCQPCIEQRLISLKIGLVRCPLTKIELIPFRGYCFADFTSGSYF